METADGDDQTGPVRLRQGAWLASLVLLAFGGYLLAGGMVVMLPGLAGRPDLTADGLADRTVAQWLWWLGGACALVGCVGTLRLERSVVRHGGPVDPAVRYGRIVTISALLAVALIVLGTVLVHAAAPHSDLLGWLWLQCALSLSIVTLAVVLAIVRRPDRDRNTSAT